jgi:NAD+--asparagine ADP-ribosyltransferase
MHEKHTVQKKTHDAQKNTHGKLSAHDKVSPFHTQNKWNIIIYKNVVVRWR